MEDRLPYLVWKRLTLQRTLGSVNKSSVFNEYIFSKVLAKERKDIEKDNGIRFGIGLILATVFVSITGVADELVLCFHELADDFLSMPEEDLLLVEPIVVEGSSS